MDMTCNSCFLLDIHSPYDRNNDVRGIFKLYDNWYCIREINDLDWGRPQFEELGMDDSGEIFKLYSTLDEAWDAVRALKRAEASSC